MSQILRKVICSAKSPSAIGPYSQAIQVDKTLYISGQVGVDPTSMKLVGDDIESQTKQALTNMENVLATANCNFSNVVKTTVLLADINDFTAMNNVYSTLNDIIYGRLPTCTTCSGYLEIIDVYKVFKQPYPARAAYQVARLPLSAKIEIEAIAVVGDLINE